jgi:hypothetical protein
MRQDIDKPLKWLADDIDACFFTWLFLQNRYSISNFSTNYYFNYLKTPFFGEIIENQRFDIETLNRSKIAEHISDRVKRFSAQVLGLYNHEAFINELHILWTSIDKSHPFDKSPSFKEAKWNWSYLEKTFGKQSPKPNTQKNFELYTIATYRLHLNDRTKAELFDIKYKKALSQFRYREKLSASKLKPINTHLTKETKEKLDILCKKHDKKINAMLEYIIEKEYEEISQ